MRWPRDASRRQPAPRASLSPAGWLSRTPTCGSPGARCTASPWSAPSPATGSASTPSRAAPRTSWWSPSPNPVSVRRHRRGAVLVQGGTSHPRDLGGCRKAKLAGGALPVPGMGVPWEWRQPDARPLLARHHLGQRDRGHDPERWRPRKMQAGCHHQPGTHAGVRSPWEDAGR